VAQYGQDYGVVPASVCGSGPYKLKEWTKDDRMELVRHDGYSWGSPAYDNTGAPWVDRIVFRTLPEDAARAAELETGGIDLDVDVAPQHIARLEGKASRSRRFPGSPPITSASTWRRMSSRTCACARRWPMP
jgi:peptide/nickel transport system substrate-binding protein